MHMAVMSEPLSSQLCAGGKLGTKFLAATGCYPMPARNVVPSAHWHPAQRPARLAVRDKMTPFATEGA